ISVSNNDSDFSTGSVSSKKDSNFDSKFNIKVIIKFTIESDNFDIFQDNLIKHIQDCIDNNDFNKNNIEVSYKINGREQAIALDNKDDYNIFISECKKLEKLSSIPSLQEFFEKLDKNHNGNGGYLDLIAGFEQEKITVNTIKDLSDSELIQLGITKIG
ncbi:4896_t:CDS:2, partial [Racocetra persica]